MTDYQVDLTADEINAMFGGAPSPSPTPYAVDFTADELSQQINGPQRTWPEFAMGALNQPLQGASFRFSDEVAGRGAAGVSSIADALMGNIDFNFNQILDTYSARVDPAVDMIRQSTESVAQDYPIGSTIAEIGGAVTSIPSKIVAGGGNLLSKVPYVGKALGYGGAGATSGALYGAGSAEGGMMERAEQGAEGAVTGALMDAGFKGVGDLVKKGGQVITGQADGLRSSAIGLTKADRAKAVKSTREAIKFNETGRDAVDRALDVAEKYKIIESVDPMEIVQKNTRALSTIGDEIGRVVATADEIQANLVPTPTFKKTEEWIMKKTTGTEKRKLLKQFQDEADLIAQDLDGSITSLFRQKQNLGERSYSVETTSNQKKMIRIMTRELKDSVEGQVRMLEKAGQLPNGTLESFRSNNYDYEHLKKFEKAFLRNAVKERGQDFVKDSLIPALRTSGGFGVPMLAGAYMGAPILGLTAGAAGAYATTPQGKMQLSKMARSGMAEAPGNFLQGNRGRVANIINSQYQKP